MRSPILILCILLLGCTPAERRVDAARYDSFWLWAGVKPQPLLDRAKTLYLLEGEIVGDPPRFRSLRPGVPRAGAAEVWMVVRTDTLAWPQDAERRLLDKLDRWKGAGGRVEGLQIDFDARTRGVGDYAAFLAGLRRRLPTRYKLSVTGLMDWSANGDPRALAALAPVVDEVVIQTYQGRDTIPGYERYFRKLDRFPVPFKIGLVQRGEWREPDGLATNPRFRGYVVFLLNDR